MVSPSPSAGWKWTTRQNKCRNEIAGGEELLHPPPKFLIAAVASSLPSFPGRGHQKYVGERGHDTPITLYSSENLFLFQINTWQNGADEQVRATLQQLPDQQFDSPADVSKAVGAIDRKQ